MQHQSLARENPARAAPGMLRVTTQLRHTMFSWQSCRHSQPSQWRFRQKSAVLCKAAVEDEVHRCMSANNEVSLLTVSATQLVQEVSAILLGIH